MSLRDPDLAARMARDGFAVVDLMPADAAAALRAEIEALHRRAGEADGGSFNHRDAAVRQEAQATALAALAPHAEQLFEGCTPLLAGYIVRGTDAPELGLHQDWAMTADPAVSVYSLWCPLVEVDEANGGLALVPGSHRIRSQISGPGIPGYWHDYAERLRELGPPVRARPGQAVLYDGRTLHWVPANRSGAVRPVATISFVPVDATPALHLPVGDKLEIVDMSGDGFAVHGAIDCQARDLPRPRLGTIPNPNRAIPWSEFTALAGHAEREPALIVSHLAKKYCRETPRALRYAAADIVHEFLPRRGPAPLRPGEFMPLDDVSFTLHPGEALAVLGPNGAGKTSLLKTVNGLLKPSSGEVRARGTIGAIIELGSGLSPLLTGRENILLGAALAGKPERVAREALQQVIEFAELEDAVDAPVQSYSSGMKARLAFAMATHPRPDILLVDEALAVGDIHFQRKCVRHMRSHLAQGGCLLFVSHNVFQIQAVCERGLLLDRGKVVYQGSAVEAVKRMFETGRGEPVPAAAPDAGGPVVLTSLAAEPVVTEAVQAGAAMRIRLGYIAEEAHDVIWGFSIWTEDLSTCVTGGHDLRARTIPAGRGELTCTVPGLPLVPGDYALRATIVDEHSVRPLARWGWENEPQLFRVRGIADLHQNAQVAMNQLVTMDVDWARP